ncbi:glycosyltransferase, partial [Staphylococcus aureus]
MRVFRQPSSGKAEALNAGITEIDTDIVVTIDADTALAPNALAAIRRAFADDASIVAAGGIMHPVSDTTFLGRILQCFR